MKNSFKELSKSDILNIKTKTYNLYNELRTNAFKDNPFIKYESYDVRNVAKYKYNKKNIFEIIKRYNSEFKEFGIEFKYIPYKLKKR